jgi:hypothetical protein
VLATACLLLTVIAAAPPGAAVTNPESARLLVGTWTGKATGPDGGPPTGDIVVTFARAPKSGLTGKIVVKTPGGVEYSGVVSNIDVVKKVFSATVTFKLGENPTEAAVTGPVTGRTIAGTFSVTTGGQKIGEGSFSIKKESAAARP